MAVAVNTNKKSQLWLIQINKKIFIVYDKVMENFIVNLNKFKLSFGSNVNGPVLGILPYPRKSDRVLSTSVFVAICLRVTFGAFQ